MMTKDELSIVLNALQSAEAEIHNPGSARYGGYDLLNLIENAKRLVKSRLGHNDRR
jgi:hypothetical protein